MTELPEATRKDKAIAAAVALTKGAVDGVPVVGSFLSEIVDLLYRQPIEGRRERWLHDVADALSEIKRQQEELTPERLSTNPEFITLLHRATEGALRTHQDEKRRLLRNAVINGGLPTAPDLDKQLFFLRLVEELSVNQITVLVLYRNPKAWFQKRHLVPKDYYMGGRDAVVEQAYPDLAKHPDFKLLVLGDLEKRALMFGLSGMVSGGAVYDSVTTPIANEFLDFVSAESENAA